MIDRMREPPGWKWGDLIPSAGYARCYGCHRPWHVTNGQVSVSYDPNRSQFVLCRPCWDRSTVAQRVEAHRWACGEWARLEGQRQEPLHTEPPISVIVDRIERAIRAGDPQMWAASGM